MLWTGLDCESEPRKCGVQGHRATGSRGLQDGVVKLMLDAGCVAEASEMVSYTSIHEAVCSGATETIKLLLNAESKGKVNSMMEGLTLIQEPARGCRKNAVEILFDAGANFNVHD